MRLVVGEGVRFAALGTALGLAVALGAGRWIAPLLTPSMIANCMFG